MAEGKEDVLLGEERRRSGAGHLSGQRRSRESRSALFLVPCSGGRAVGGAELIKMSVAASRISTWLRPFALYSLIGHRRSTGPHRRIIGTSWTTANCTTATRLHSSATFTLVLHHPGNVGSLARLQLRSVSWAVLRVLVSFAHYAVYRVRRPYATGMVSAGEFTISPAPTSPRPFPPHPFEPRRSEWLILG